MDRAEMKLVPIAGDVITGSQKDPQQWQSDGFGFLYFWDQGSSADIVIYGEDSLMKNSQKVDYITNGESPYPNYDGWYKTTDWDMLKVGNYIDGTKTVGDLRNEAKTSDSLNEIYGGNYALTFNEDAGRFYLQKRTN